MAYENNDDDRLRSTTDVMKSRRRVNEGAGLSAFVFAGIIFALIIGGIFMFTGDNTNMASNESGPMATGPARVAPPVSITGSGSNSPGATTQAPSTPR